MHQQSFTSSSSSSSSSASLGYGKWVDWVSEWANEGERMRLLHQSLLSLSFTWSVSLCPFLPCLITVSRARSVASAPSAHFRLMVLLPVARVASWPDGQSMRWGRKRKKETKKRRANLRFTYSSEMCLVCIVFVNMFFWLLRLQPPWFFKKTTFANMLYR